MYWLPDDGNVWEQIGPESGREGRGPGANAAWGAARPGALTGVEGARAANEANMIETINLQHFPNPQLLWGVFSL